MFEIRVLRGNLHNEGLGPLGRRLRRLWPLGLLTKHSLYGSECEKGRWFIPSALLFSPVRIPLVGPYESRESGYRFSVR
jgi:hypothetical protein